MSVWPISHPRDSDAEQVYQAIQRGWRQLCALPGSNSAITRRSLRSPAYLALEAEIRQLAEQYKTLTTRGQHSQCGLRGRSCR